jgi:hypothetical protein
MRTFSLFSFSSLVAHRTLRLSTAPFPNDGDEVPGHLFFHEKDHLQREESTFKQLSPSSAYSPQPSKRFYAPETEAQSVAWSSLALAFTPTIYLGPVIAQWTTRRVKTGSSSGVIHITIEKLPKF